MATLKNNTLKERLARYRQMKLTVTGSDTQWYKNVLKNPTIRIDARGTEAEFRAVLITERKAVKSVIGRFQEKYGAGDVKKYYSKLDVAVAVELKL